MVGHEQLGRPGARESREPAVPTPRRVWVWPGRDNGGSGGSSGGGEGGGGGGYDGGGGGADAAQAGVSENEPA
ncbi:hypothetical protein RF55_4118 [Lasius niger]|uniref:Uncharacterized protein n=1 Tax=Lasius niger TaxID=67767 RepID=A0A0J7KZI7_LASNI|nr:hypothetical protein RF55_4118 [Lasius niger]